MKRLLLIWILFLPFWIAAQDGYAGRDFWFTSSTNLRYQDSTLVYIIGDTACTGYVENPNTSYYEIFNVVPDSVTILIIPPSEIQCPVSSGGSGAIHFNLGIHLSSTRNIYAYLQTHCTDSIYSAEPVLPDEKEIHTFPLVDFDSMFTVFLFK